MLAFLEIWLTVIRFKLGLYNFNVKDLHTDYMTGNLQQNQLFMYLRPKQIVEFIEHHRGVKEKFENGSENGVLKIDEFSDGFRKIVQQDPYLSKLLGKNELILPAEDRRKMYFTLNQLDRLIEDGILEERVIGKKHNYIASKN